MNQNQKPEVITSTEATKVAATQELPIKELIPATTAQAEPKSKKAKKNKAAKAKAAAKAKQTEPTTGKVKKVKKTKKEVALAAPEVKADKKKKKTAKDKAVEDTANQQKPSIIEEVISHRDVKYIYPEDVTDTLTRKSWRQKVRAKLRQLERDMFRITDQNSKEYKKAKKAYEEYRAEVLKPAQAV